MGTTIGEDFGGETTVKKRRGGFRSTAPHQRCFNKQFSLVQYIISVFLQVTKFDSSVRLLVTFCVQSSDFLSAVVSRILICMY